jgi:hypothetical protein
MGAALSMHKIQLSCYVIPLLCADHASEQISKRMVFPIEGECGLALRVLIVRDFQILHADLLVLCHLILKLYTDE